MKHEDLPERWKLKIIEFLNSKGEHNRTQLNAFDFANSKEISLEFEDSSFANFQYAFTIEAPEFNEVAVFTEHCGYHIFNLRGTSIKRI